MIPEAVKLIPILNENPRIIDLFIESLFPLAHYLEDELKWKSLKLRPLQVTSYWPFIRKQLQVKPFQENNYFDEAYKTG